MSRILYLESVAGVAGDMFAAAFVDAGLVSVEELARLPGQLGFAGVTIEARPVLKAAIRATHLRVLATAGPETQPWGHAHGGTGAEPVGHVHESTETHLVVDAPAQHQHTHYVDIDRRLTDSQLPPAAATLARRIFRLLAEAEAAAHGTALKQVAFHEVGSIDSIVDVAMAAYCVSKIQPVRCCASPIRPGRGFARMAHGTLPIPPPASTQLLVGLAVAGTPGAIERENVELSTPTGIAILKALAPEFVRELPSGTIRHQGMGAGTMDLGAFPNVFRVHLLDAAATPAAALPYESDRIVELCCNIDDDTGEHLAWLAERLMAEGALDVALFPGTGKKGRPLVMLSVLSPLDQWQRHADWLLKNSTTFGLRHREWDRLKLARRFESQTGATGPAETKIGLTTDGKVVKQKLEFEPQRPRLEWRDPGAR